MTLIQRIITILMVILGTMLTRFIPFIIFRSDKPTPGYIKTLGKILPSAALGMLAVYCFKDVTFLSGTHGIPEMAALVLVIFLHTWKKNMLLSIAAGTLCYMALVQFIFV